MNSKHDYTPGTDEDDEMPNFDNIVNGDFLAAFEIPPMPSPRMDFRADLGPEKAAQGQGPAAGTRNGNNGEGQEGQQQQRPMSLELLAEQVKAINYRLNAMEQTIFGNLVQFQAQQMMPIQPVGHAGRADHSEPRMRDLDVICQPEFALNPMPSNIDLNRMSQTLLHRFPGSGRRQMLAVIRKWYRKKRDENGQKVFTACINIVQPLVDDNVSIDGIREMMEHDMAFVQRMLVAANLDIEDEEKAIHFLKQKIEAYITRRVLHHR